MHHIRLFVRLAILNIPLMAECFLFGQRSSKAQCSEASLHNCILETDPHHFPSITPPALYFPSSTKRIAILFIIRIDSYFRYELHFPCPFIPKSICFVRIIVQQFLYPLEIRWRSFTFLVLVFTRKKAHSLRLAMII